MYWLYIHRSDLERLPGYHMLVDINTPIVIYIPQRQIETNVNFNIQIIDYIFTIAIAVESVDYVYLLW